MLVQDLLQLLVQFVTLAEQVIQFDLAQDIAQCGLREEGCSHPVVLHLNDRLCRVDHPVVDDCIHLHAHIIPGYDHLLGNVDGENPQVEEYDPVNDGDDEEYARPLHSAETAQTEYDHPLIFADDLDRLRQYHQYDKQRYKSIE
ncbi:MAG: hypothetical protein A4E43_01038 [Methanosaeta sp. PtaB.Bin005]|nr:MAG: hypothetical protein A4E43_01038 [Methanosaeta sp. PtaB.Bin005]